ncbi:MAG: hypothetical protein VW270_01690 [Candidatus Poseidoniales archaeon]
MNTIYNMEQLKKYLSTLPLGTEAVEKITEFAQLQNNQLEWSRQRCDIAAKMLGHDLINEMME